LLSPSNREGNVAEQQFNLEGVTPLKTLLEQTPGMSSINKSYSETLGGLGELPTPADIANQNKYNMTGANAAENLNNFYNKLPPDMQASQERQFSSLGQASKIAQKISEPSLLGGFIPAKKVLYGGANTAGLAVRSLYDMAPEEVQTLAQSVAKTGGELGTKLGGLLSEAAGRDHMGRNALLFGIQQNPAYRDLLKQANGESNGQ
jgi:hypothetical protein